MHLTAIGNMGVGAHLTSTVPFEDQEIYAVTVSNTPHLDAETIALISASDFQITSIDFQNGEIVLAPTVDRP
ncbi:hypothetical protein GCM10027578_22050 [Spirosoma luteolum]